jgi:hypothetical protein
MLPSYLTTSDADALAAQLPGLAAYKAITDDAAKLALLSLASLRVDNSRKWQGRKYDTSGAQVLAFPRVPHAAPSSVVWDWDADAEEAVVPQDVKIAVMFEANSIADGARDRVLELQAMGLAGRSTGSLSEQYRAAFAGQSAGTKLSLQADDLVEKYRLRTGGIR